MSIIRNHYVWLPNIIQERLREAKKLHVHPSGRREISGLEGDCEGSAVHERLQ